MKPPKIALEGKNYFAWPYEEQTKVKHKVLSYYWRIWLSKLGKFSDTLFMDCHGGCGVYIDEATHEISYGSSILIDKIASEVNSNRNYRNYVFVSETDPEYLKNLQEAWKNQKCSKLCRFVNKDFNEVINENLLNSFHKTHPTLFFIDPFGYNLKMSTMSSLMKFRGNEIIINFMFDHLYRFLVVDKIDKQRDEYFGCNEWRKAFNMQNDEREVFLVNLYRKQLKKTTGAKFVFPYRLCYPDKKQTYYYLIHATNNIQGIANMKSSFANVNGGKMEYIGKLQDQVTLFDLETFKTSELSKILLNKFCSTSITFIDILEDIIEDVPFLEKDLSDTLLELEKEDKVKIKRVSSKRGRVKDSDIIIFGDNNANN